VSATWDSFRQQWMILVASYVLVMIVDQVAQVPGVVLAAIAAVAQIPPSVVFGLTPRIVQLGVSIPVLIAVSAFFQVGLIRLWLQVARGERPQFEVIFTGIDRFLPLLGLSLLMAIAITLGFVLFIVPGVLLALAWSMAPFYLVDRNYGPVEALEASWEATRGHWGSLFLLSLAAVGFSILGVASCCIGILASSPLTMLLFATAYTRMARPAAPTPSAYPY
jgi:uncharacterized membrane protein